MRRVSPARVRTKNSVTSPERAWSPTAAKTASAPGTVTAAGDVRARHARAAQLTPRAALAGWEGGGDRDAGRADVRLQLQRDRRRTAGGEIRDRSRRRRRSDGDRGGRVRR